MHQCGFAVHVGHVGKAALGQRQRVLGKTNYSHHASSSSVAPKRVRMASSKTASLAKCYLGGDFGEPEVDDDSDFLVTIFDQNLICII